MYCLDKLQREIAYFFSKDIRELPKVESLLAEAGYTQIRKGDEIIEIDLALGRHSDDSSLSQEIKDIIDTSPAKGRDMQIIGEANFTPQVVEYAHKNNKKVAIDKLEQAEAERLGFKHPQDVRVTIDYQAINHTLNRHGAESALVKNSGQKAVDYTDIAEYRNIVKGADEKLFSKDDLGQDVILSFKQVNGYAVVVESIRKKGNELAFKSMYFENGSYKNSNAYKNAVDSQKANPSPAPYGYEPHADANTPPLKTDTEIIPQTQMPKDNSDPVKTFEYFRDDFIKEYPQALESYSGQIPLPSELSFGVEQSLLKEIRTIKEAMNNTAKDKFKELLKNIGLKQNEITQVLDTTIRSDIDYTLDSVKEYLDYVARHLENFPPEHKPIAQEILTHSQNILNIFENKTPQIQQLQKKRELITSFHNNAKTSNTKEQDLLKGLIDELYKPQSKQTPKALESTPKDAPPPPTQKGLFDEVDSSLATPKQKTIEKVDSYTKSDDFKTLSKDKQEAILSLKTIEPSPMPQEITQENLENLFRHFNSKQDKAQREFYAKLFNDTKENPHITLEVKRDNETRQEYIKAYQHKDTHDLYYIAITKENDTIKVTGYPITKIKDVINQIKNAEKVVWRHQGDQTHTALDSKESLSLENASTIIPQQKPYTDEKKTLQGFEQAIAGKDTHTKIQIAKEHLEYLHTPLKEQKDQLKELIKTKNFDDDEIAEALQRIETTAKPYAKKRGNIFVPFVDKPGTGWLISDKLTPLEQAKTLIAYELERENKQFFTQVSKLGAELRFLDRFKGVLQEKSAQEWHFREFDETLDFIAKELKKHDKQDKDAKSYEMTYTQARDLFYKASPTQIQTELFEKVLPIAQKLGVNIRSAVRFRYERASSDFTKDIAGMYRTNPNAATLKKGISQEIKHEVLLHELIHSVTSRAIYAYDRGQLDLLTTPQQNAIKNIKEIYAELFSKRDELGLKRWQGGEHTGDYGLKNEHEMLAELANPRFVEKLKNIGLFEKLVDNIIKLIASAKEIFGLKKTNAYERLKGELESIITNYKDDFSTQWEAQKFRDRAMGSEKVDSSKITIAQEPTEPKTLSPQEAKELLESKQGQRLPQELDIQSFLKSLESVENKENFIAHLQKKDDAQSRLAYLHIVEPTLKTPDIELTKGERKTKIKVFNDGENFYSFLIADLADKRLFTFLPKARKGYIETKIKNADLIQTFTSQASKDQEPNGLARHSIAQDSNAVTRITMKKFNYDERKAKDLLEWHKDSHPLTKDENGVPKVFYHGTGWREIGNKIFEVFDTKYSNQVDKFLQGHYFSSSKKIARTYDANNIYKVFLNAKNPLVIDFKGHTFNDYIDEAINNIPKSVQENIRDFYDSIIFKNIIDDNTQNGKKHPVADTIMVLDSNQIKHIENRGIESEQGRKYFNESSPNIFHSNPHAGAGLLGGSVAGVEQDENGNITFSPEKFALGLLGGTGGSIAISKAKNTLKSTQNAVSLEKAQGQSKEMQQQLQSTIQTHLENLPPSPTPQPINEAKIKALIKRFDNIENLQEHLNTRADTKARQEIFSLLDDTLQTPQVHYKKDGKDKYLKRYKSERKEPYFYLLVTKDEDKTFITHFKTRDSKYLSKEITKAQEIIQGADIIEALSQRTGDI